MISSRDALCKGSLGRGIATNAAVINYAFTVYSRVARARFNRTPATVIVRGARINSIASVTARRKLVIIEYQTAGCFGPAAQRARERAAFCAEISLVARPGSSRRRERGRRDACGISRIDGGLDMGRRHEFGRLSRNRSRARARTLIYDDGGDAPQKAKNNGGSFIVSVETRLSRQRASSSIR